MFKKATIQDIDVKDKVVLVRVDYNVPLKDGKITSDLRIRSSLPTLNYLLEHKAKKIILISHLGRPEKQRIEELSLKPAAEALKKLLKETEVEFVSEVAGAEVENAVKNLKDGGILLLENLRFFPGEEENSEGFIKGIVESTGAEIFVQDGFAVIHRAHASTDAIKNCLPVYAGLLLKKEIENLSKVTENPERPFLFILGGSKVEDKQPLIDKFIDKADNIVIGGKIAADGYQSDNEKIYVAEDFDEDGEGAKLDIGPVSTVKISDMISESKLVVWNGVLGKVEDTAFATSSTIVAKMLGENPNTTSIICGGDTAGFAENLMEEFPNLSYSLVSTGGGASLEFLCGKSLPGLEAVENK